MITVRLSGGLGNQMFQYAAGLSLALRHRTGVQLDARSYQRDRLRDFGLDHFGLQPTTSKEVINTLPPIRRGVVSFPWWKLRHGRQIEYVRERGEPCPTTQSPLMSVGTTAYLHGYWQSETHFVNHADQVRQSLRIASHPGPVNQAWLDRIREVRSVSIHVRRGDYTSDTANQSQYASCDIGYYRRAAEYLARKSDSAVTFYVFSDDPLWAKENLKLPGETEFVTHNSGSAFIEDLRLMSACRHHIIANSTFSWWGAWLGENSERVIVAPSKWYRNADRDRENPIPSNWVRIQLGD